MSELAELKALEHRLTVADQALEEVLKANQEAIIEVRAIRECRSSPLLVIHGEQRSPGVRPHPDPLSEHQDNVFRAAEGRMLALDRTIDYAMVANRNTLRRVRARIQELTVHHARPEFPVTFTHPEEPLTFKEEREVRESTQWEDGDPVLDAAGHHWRARVGVRWEFIKNPGGVPQSA
jgi:hypothetical protein